MNFFRVAVCPVTIVLLVHVTCEMKMGLIWHPQLVQKFIVLVLFVVVCWQNSNRNWWSFSFSSCTICILYGWNFKSTWRIRRTHSRDNLTAAASLRTERCGLRKTETRAASMFCGVRVLLGRPVGFFFRADPVSSKFLIQVLIACFERTRPWSPKLKKTSELLLPTFQTIIVFVKHFYGEARCWPFRWSMITEWRGCLLLKVPVLQRCQLYMAATTHFKSSRFLCHSVFSVLCSSCKQKRVTCNVHPFFLILNKTDKYWSHLRKFPSIKFH